jgi:hypothetical protein
MAISVTMTRLNRHVRFSHTKKPVAFHLLKRHPGLIQKCKRPEKTGAGFGEIPRLKDISLQGGDWIEKPFKKRLNLKNVVPPGIEPRSRV